MLGGADGIGVCFFFAAVFVRDELHHNFFLRALDGRQRLLHQRHHLLLKGFVKPISFHSLYLFIDNTVTAFNFFFFQSRTGAGKFLYL